VTLLLLFRRGYGDWPERPPAAAEVPTTPAADRLLLAPKQELERRPVKKPAKKTALR